MSELKPCPICGDENEYMRFLNKCAERAKESLAEREAAIMRLMVAELERAQIVHCRDCKHFTPQGTHKFENGKTNKDSCIYIRGFVLQITPDGFCAWGERKQ